MVAASHILGLKAAEAGVRVPVAAVAGGRLVRSVHMIHGRCSGLRALAIADAGRWRGRPSPQARAASRS